MAAIREGRFVWYELLTTDTASAISFYPDVVGWTTRPWGGGYTMWIGSQGPLGGTMALAHDAKHVGAPPHWTGSVRVTNVDEAVELARRRGGACPVGPMDIPEVGRYALIADPQGATIGVFEPAMVMDLHDTSKPGELSWNELMTSDHDAAFRFYSELFGWRKVLEHDMGEMGKYLTFGRDGVQLGGMFTRPRGMPAPSAWLYYIRVSDLDASLARARAKGAYVLNDPMDVPGGGRIVQLADPQGAAFALHSGD